MLSNSFTAEMMYQNHHLISQASAPLTAFILWLRTSTIKWEAGTNMDYPPSCRYADDVIAAP
jgi:hypothetical protein